MGLLQSCKQTLCTGRQDNNKKLCLLPAELGHCQELSQVSVLSVPFHWSKKTIFLVTKSRTLQICLECNCVYNRFCKVKCVQSTPHNSNLLGKSKKVWIIRSSKQITGIGK